MQRRSETLLLGVLAGVLVIAAACVDRFSGPEFAGLRDVLLNVAIAVATLATGWIGGLLALVLFPSVLWIWSPAVLQRPPSEWLECLIMLVAVAATRKNWYHLRRAERKLRALVASMHDRIVIFDDSGRFVEVIPTRTTSVFKPTKDLIGLRLADVVPEHAATHLSYIRTALAERRIVQHDYVLEIDGSMVWLSATVSPLTDRTVLWVSRDITARKLAESELQRTNNELERRVEQRTRDLAATESRFRSVFEQANDIIFTMTRDRRITSLNPAFTRVTGYPVIDWMARDLLDLVMPEFRPNGAELFAQALITGRLESIAHVRGVDGPRILEVSLSTQVVNGESVGFLGFARDVTERKMAEEQMRASDERFRLLARATSDAIWDLDPQTGRVWRGEGYETLFGYAPGSIGPSVEHFRELVHPDDVEKLSRSFRHALDSGQPSFTHEFRFRRADGSYADILDRGYIVRDSDGRPRRVVGAMIDCSERKKMTEQLEQAKRLSSLGRLAGSIAHEFNNVLMGVQANAEVIGRRGPAELRRLVDNIVASVRRGRKITEEILRYMRPSDPEPRPIEVRGFLEEWAAELQPALRNRLDVRIDVAGNALYAHADPQLIAQVLTNMAYNARDAMPETGGTLTIGAEEWSGLAGVSAPGKFVHLSLRDDGCGIADDQLAHIFEPLYTTKRDGTGLGLAVSYQIVTRSGGHILVESEVGRGTTFHVFLPVGQPVERSEAAPEVSRLSAGRILLVEDELEVAEGVALLLEADGAEVCAVHTGGETVAAIERFSPDVVILDIGLPDIDGIEVYEQIHQRWPDLRVLFSSGHAQAQNLEKWLGRSNVALLVKPYEMTHLRTALAGLKDVTAA